jgi:hypothetical protein
MYFVGIDSNTYKTVKSSSDFGFQLILWIILIEKRAAININTKADPK